MRKLMKKELFLCLHPTAVIFLLLSAMLLIPNYPYYVVFFYTTLAVFFICLLGRENNDVAYSMALPIAKRDIVKGRFAIVILLELLQMLVAGLFAIIRQILCIPANQAGMDANITLFGLAFVLYGLFNLVFFVIYYHNVQKVGKAFIWASAIMLFYVMLMETFTFTVAFFRDYLDTPDPLYLGCKFIVLTIGIALYCLLTALSYRCSVAAFEKLDF